MGPVAWSLRSLWAPAAGNPVQRGNGLRLQGSGGRGWKPSPLAAVRTPRAPARRRAEERWVFCFVLPGAAAPCRRRHLGGRTLGSPALVLRSPLPSPPAGGPLHLKSPQQPPCRLPAPPQTVPPPCPGMPGSLSALECDTACPAQKPPQPPPEAAMTRPSASRGLLPASTLGLCSPSGSRVERTPQRGAAQDGRVAHPVWGHGRRQEGEEGYRAKEGGHKRGVRREASCSPCVAGVSFTQRKPGLTLGDEDTASQRGVPPPATPGRSHRPWTLRAGDPRAASRGRGGPLAPWGGGAPGSRARPQCLEQPPGQTTRPLCFRANLVPTSHATCPVPGRDSGEDTEPTNHSESPLLGEAARRGGPQATPGRSQGLGHPAILRLLTSRD